MPWHERMEVAPPGYGLDVHNLKVSEALRDVR